MKKMKIGMRDIFFPSHDEVIREFEHIGEKELRYKIAHGTFLGNRQLAEEWLRQKEEARGKSNSQKRDEREEEAIAIAKRAADAASEAARFASEQARWARWAVIIAIIAALIAIKDDIPKLIAVISY